MKFNLEISAGHYHILSYQSGQIGIYMPPDTNTAHPTTSNVEVLSKSLVIMPRELVRDWPPQTFSDLNAGHFDMLADLQPEFVLFGSGAQIRFPFPSLTANLLNKGIGVEVMDTGAACRTYNIMMGEGRNVAAALLMI